MTTSSSRSTVSTQKNDSARPLIIPIFLPHMGCPHQCLFCNQHQITGKTDEFPSLSTISNEIERFLTYNGGRRSSVQISFYGGNFLGLPLRQITELLSCASQFVQKGHVNGIRFSTRPDTIDAERLELISSFPVSTIELGVQSMNNQVLGAARRGHLGSDSKKAVMLLKQAGYEIGLQLMLGLPEDTLETLLDSCRQIINLEPDFVRIYPTLILRHSPLAKWYQEGKYTPLTLEKAVDYAKRLYLLFHQKNIKVIRMGLQASSELNQSDTVLAGPYHPAFGHLVFSAIYLDGIRRSLLNQKAVPSKIDIRCHPKDVSKARGLKNQNLSQLKKEFNLEVLNIVADTNLALGSISINQEKPFSIF